MWKRTCAGETEGLLSLNEGGQYTAQLNVSEETGNINTAQGKVYLCYCQQPVCEDGTMKCLRK